jgi:hypothetical protein
MLQGATGSMLGTVRLRNVSQTRCALGGRPAVTITSPAGARFPTRERAFAPNGAGGGRLETLRPGRAALLALQWTNWCGAWSGRAGSARVLSFQLALTNGGRLTLHVLTGRPRCDRRSAPSRLFVSSFSSP